MRFRTSRVLILMRTHPILAAKGSNTLGAYSILEQLWERIVPATSLEFSWD